MNSQLFSDTCCKLIRLFPKLPHDTEVGSDHIENTIYLVWVLYSWSGSLIKIINYSPASYAQILVGKNFV
jgi:hypothetical protein